MPYVSEKQRKYFNANRAELEAAGVDVDHWNDESRGKKLPKRKRKKVKNDNRKQAAMLLLSLKYDQQKTAAQRSLLEEARELRELGRRQLYQKVAVGEEAANYLSNLKDRIVAKARILGKKARQAVLPYTYALEDKTRNLRAGLEKAQLELQMALRHPKLVKFVQENPDAIKALRAAGIGSLAGAAGGVGLEALRTDGGDKKYLGRALRGGLLGGAVGGLGSYGLSQYNKQPGEATPDVIEGILNNSKGLSQGAVIARIEQAIPDPAERSKVVQEYLRQNPNESLVSYLRRGNEALVDPLLAGTIGAGAGGLTQNLMSQRLKPDANPFTYKGYRIGVPWVQTAKHVGADQIDPKQLEKVLKRHVPKSMHKNIKAALEDPKKFKQIANLRYLDDTLANPSLAARRKIDHDIRSLGRRAVGRSMPKSPSFMQNIGLRMPRIGGAALGGAAGLALLASGAFPFLSGTATPEAIEIPNAPPNPSQP